MMRFCLLPMQCSAGASRAALMRKKEEENTAGGRCFYFTLQISIILRTF